MLGCRMMSSLVKWSQHHGPMVKAILTFLATSRVWEVLVLRIDAAEEDNFCTFILRGKAPPMII